MKKALLVLLNISFLCACSGKEEPTAATSTVQKDQATTVVQEQSQTQQNFPPCTINGHDCWEIIQLLKETKSVYSTSPETEMYSPDIESFKNSALEAKGFSVGYYGVHNRVGLGTASLSWGESDWVNMEMSYEDEKPSILKLSFSNGVQQQYDLLKKHIK